jgi:hypothetical protein
MIRWHTSPLHTGNWILFPCLFAEKRASDEEKRQKGGPHKCWRELGKKTIMLHITFKLYFNEHPTVWVIRPSNNEKSLSVYTAHIERPLSTKNTRPVPTYPHIWYQAMVANTRAHVHIHNFTLTAQLFFLLFCIQLSRRRVFQKRYTEKNIDRDFS